MSLVNRVRDVTPAPLFISCSLSSRTVYIGFPSFFAISRSSLWAGCVVITKSMSCKGVRLRCGANEVPPCPVELCPPSFIHQLENNAFWPMIRQASHIPKAVPCMDPKSLGQNVPLVLVSDNTCLYRQLPQFESSTRPKWVFCWFLWPFGDKPPLFQSILRIYESITHLKRAHVILTHQLHHSLRVSLLQDQVFLQLACSGPVQQASQRSEPGFHSAQAPLLVACNHLRPFDLVQWRGRILSSILVQQGLLRRVYRNICKLVSRKNVPEIL